MGKMAVADKKEAHKKKQFSWKNMEEFCQAFEAMTQFLGDVNTTITSTENETEKDAETKALMNMCDRCAGQQQGKKKGGLCRKKWTKLVESKSDEDENED